MEGLVSGRIVHYVPLDGGEHLPAMIIRPLRNEKGEFVSGAACDLEIFSGPNHHFLVANHDDGKTKAPGTWHWIEKEYQEEMEEKEPTQDTVG